MVNPPRFCPIELCRVRDNWDNACIECFFSFLKSERQTLKTVATVDEAKEIVHEYIRYYNHTRIQGVLDYRTPHD